MSTQPENELSTQKPAEGLQKFRKKPVVIEAIRWDGENVSGIVRFCGGAASFNHRNPTFFTAEGEMEASIGDWIIKEPFPIPGREFYPCKPDIFAATYEPSAPSPAVAPPIEAREWLEARLIHGGHWDGYYSLDGQSTATTLELLTAYYAACRQPDIAEERRKERAGIMAALRIICEAESWGAALGVCCEDEPEIAALIQNVRAACRLKGK